MNYTDEIEKWVPEYETLYSITNYGRVFSYNYRNQGIKKELKLVHNTHDRKRRSGYILVQITLVKNGIKETYTVAHLVAAAFIGPNPDPDYYGVLHKDGNSTNNNVNNLYYGTQLQNCHDAIKHGTFNHSGWAYAKGVTHGRAKLNEDKVLCIRALYDVDYSTKWIASLWEVKGVTVWYIGRRKSWRHLPEQTAEESKKLAQDILEYLERRKDGNLSASR